MAKSGPEHLSDALAHVFSAGGLGQALRLRSLRERWRRAVGEDIGTRTRLLGFKRGVLRVEVESSSLLQELASVYKQAILDSLASGEEPLAVRDIRFQLRR